MNGGTIASLALLGLALILPVFALRGRALDFGKAWKMAAIWTGLLVLTAMVFGWIGM